MRYTPSDCFETFPFPLSFVGMETIGQTYFLRREAIALTRQEGFTQIYNRFHDPAENSADIAELRRAHVDLDQATATAYQWHDLKLDHAFHETKQGVRFTISEAIRSEARDRLLALNHQRHAEEEAEAEAAALVAPKPITRGRKAKNSCGQTALDL